MTHYLKTVFISALVAGGASNIIGADKPIALQGKGRYVFGKIATNGPAYLLDTESGRIWKKGSATNVDIMTPVIFKTLNNDIKLQPEGNVSVARQEVQLQLEKQKLATANRLNNQAQAVVKQAIASYLKFIRKTDTLHKEIGRLIKRGKLTLAQKKALNRSLDSQCINIGKMRQDLTKVLATKKTALNTGEQIQTLRNIDTRLTGLSKNCNKLKQAIARAKSNVTDNKKPTPPAEKPL